MSRATGPVVGAAAGDRRLMRRAALVVALQTGIATALVVAVVIAIVYVVSFQARVDATERKVRDRVDDAASYGVDLGGTAPVVVNELPTGCGLADVREATAGLPAGVTELDACGTPFLAYVTDVDGVRVVSANSLAEQQEETRRLARLSIMAALLGVLAAAGLGWVVGRRAVRPLGEALASQRRFVADASHELRTPLAILLTRAQLLERSPGLGQEQQGEVRLLVQDARVLTDLVGDMLLAAELQHRPQERRPVDLARVAEEVRAAFAATADAAGVDIVLDADPGAEHVVSGVPSALRRAVAALVDNALAHARVGGTITLELRAVPGAGGVGGAGQVGRVGRVAEGGQGGRVLVRVTDDGSGLDPARAAELTHRFTRGTSTQVAVDPETVDPETAEAGQRRLGLGLALVSEVVHAHDGSLEITGEPGAGASILMTFPADRTQHRADHRTDHRPAG